MTSCIPPLDGMDVLELGCGMGQLSLYLAEQSAGVMAVDASEKMLAVAREERAHPRIRCMLASMEDLDLESASFDLVVSSLAIHYVEDHESLVKNVAGWLKPGGCFVFSIEHPMKTAPEDPDVDWLSGIGGRAIWPLSGCCAEGRREREWLSGKVVRYHRKISTILNDVVHAGLVVERVEEPSNAPNGEAFANHRERPALLIVRAGKGEQS